MKIEHNTARIRHLLEMYRLSVPDFLEKISEGLNIPNIALPEYLDTCEDLDMNFG